MEVVLSGCDGSGKTTAAQALAAFLVSRHVPVKIHWVRGSHLLASLALRVLSRFRVFRGSCNPYYRVCLPRRLVRLWVHVEFWSFIPYLLLHRMLSRLYRILVSDRGIPDFIAWIITTLNYPRFILTVYARFLVRLASKTRITYFYAGMDTLSKRADVDREFVRKECAVYDVLVRPFAACMVDTGKYGPAKAVARLLKCLELV